MSDVVFSMSDIIFSTSDVVFPTSYVVFVMFEKELPVWVLRHLQGRMPYALCAIAQNARQTAAFTLQTVAIQGVCHTPLRRH